MNGSLYLQISFKVISIQLPTALTDDFARRVMRLAVMTFFDDLTLPIRPSKECCAADQDRQQQNAYHVRDNVGLCQLHFLRIRVIFCLTFDRVEIGCVRILCLLVCEADRKALANYFG